MNTHIIYFDNDPIGYIQLYNAHDFPRENDVGIESSTSISKSLSAIDFFIGEESFLGKGLGSKILEMFFRKFVDPYFDTCFVDSDPDNLSASQDE